MTTWRRVQTLARIGKAVEHLVAASCILASGSKLNVSSAMVDDEGVDLVFHGRGGTATLAVQVKSRSTDTSVVQRRRFSADVRETNFTPHEDLYMLFVVVDLAEAQMIPSRSFQAKTLTSMRPRLERVNGGSWHRWATTLEADGFSTESRSRTCRRKSSES
jgi:hypothetical protein